MRGKRILFAVLAVLAVYFVATNTATSGSVLGSMLDTLLRWIHDIYSYLTNSTGAHP